MGLPKISIIIATKNAKALLLETIHNVSLQDYPHVEVIVIDGNSVDGTKEVLLQAKGVTHWISESDEGISDAFNKGLQLATGEYINFQGAGDTLISPDCLKTLFQNIAPDVDIVCGRVERVSEDGASRIWVSPPHPSQFHSSALLWKMALPHQALFTHRRFFERFGNFDKTVRFAMDYELLLRAYHHFPKTVLKNRVVAKWRAGGVGSNRINEIFDEYHRIKLMHQVAPRWALMFIDMLTRIKYTIKAKLLKLAY